MWASSDVTPFNTLESHLVNPVKQLRDSVFQDAYETETGMLAIDNLNLLYVAFTRAEEQLYVHAPEPSKSRKDDSVYSAGTLLYDTLQADPEWASLLNHGKNQLNLGRQVAPESHLHIDKPETQLERWISVPWKDKMWLGINKNRISIDDKEKPDTTYGLLFHRAMSLINVPGDIDALQKLIPEINNLDKQVHSRLLEEICFILEAGSEYGWFAENASILSENEILDASGKLLRPDRVVISDKAIQVIDYKTGSEEPWHADQVKQYGAILQKMNYPAARMFLVYPALRKAVEVF
jgi:ATP-dependent exoDNAse (exonuclease V) beta subunit